MRRLLWILGVPASAAGRDGSVCSVPCGALGLRTLLCIRGVAVSAAGRGHAAAGPRAICAQLAAASAMVRRSSARAVTQHTHFIVQLIWRDPLGNPHKSLFSRRGLSLEIASASELSIWTDALHSIVSLRLLPLHYDFRLKVRN